jgi:hypothetical protein
MIAHSRFNVIHLPSIGQMVKFMMIAAGPANRTASLPNFCFLHYTGNARAKLWGKNGASINYREIIENHGVGGIFTRRLVNLFCQDFLQCVKPERRWISQNKLEAYPAMNFRL